MTTATAPAPRRRARIVLMVAIGILVGLLLALLLIFAKLVQPGGVTVPKDPGGLTWVRSFYGFGAAEDSQLKSPTSVAIGPDGFVYLTDPTRARVMVFRPDGSFARLLHTGAGGTGKGQMARPESVAVSDDGEVYVADSMGAKVVVFGPDGRVVREWPVDMQARGIAVKNDRVVVLDVGKVIVFDTQGRRIVDFGTRGSEPGQIDAYQGVTTDGNNIYVADSHNKRVQAFSSDGNLLWSQPEGPVKRSVDPQRETTGPPQPFQLPQGITIDGAGRLVVADAFGFNLTALDPATGKVLGAWGDMGRGDGAFYYPTGIAYDAERNWFVVADSGNNRGQIVTLPGSGSPATAGVLQALSGPARYGLPAALLLICVLGFALAGVIWVRRRPQGTPSVDSAPNQDSQNRMWTT